MQLHNKACIPRIYYTSRLLTGCVALAKLLNLSLSQFPYL